MNSIKRHWALILSVWLVTVLGWQSTYAQQYTLAFSSVDSPNANWYIAKERQLYKKYGLDVELIFIPSSTTTISTVVAGSVAVGNISGGATANAAVGGASVVAVGCFINSLRHEQPLHRVTIAFQKTLGRRRTDIGERKTFGEISHTDENSVRHAVREMDHTRR